MCAARSGSTLLRYLLDSHPEVVCPAELDLSRTLEWASLPWIRRDEVRGVDPGAAGELSAEARRRARKVVDEVMAAFAADAGASVFVEKSPSTVQHLALVSQCYPDASYLFLYRYPLDLIASAIEASRWGVQGYIARWVNEDTSNLVAAVGQYWIDRTSEMVSFERSCSVAHLRLRYELLCSDPSGTLKDVFGFLGLDYDEQMIERTFTTEHGAGRGDFKIDFSRAVSMDSIGRGSVVPRTLGTDQIAHIDALLAELGYPSLDVGWSGGLVESLDLRRSAVTNPDPGRIAREVVAVLREREPRPLSPASRSVLPVELVVWSRDSESEARLVLGVDARVKLPRRATEEDSGPVRRVRCEGDVLLRIVTGQTALLSAHHDRLVRFETRPARAAGPLRSMGPDQVRRTASLLSTLLTPEHATGLSRRF